MSKINFNKKLDLRVTDNIMKILSQKSKLYGISKSQLVRIAIQIIDEKDILKK